MRQNEGSLVLVFYYNVTEAELERFASAQRRHINP
jgi:hypothetical protein